MKRKRKRSKLNIHPKYVYAFLTILCFVLIVLSFRFADSLVGFKTALGNVITPMQKGINSVGHFISDRMDYLTSKEELLKENEMLKQKIDELNYDNKVLAGENLNLDNYRKLYNLDQKYPEYPKVAATVVSRDGNNWFHVFTIDKGTADGVNVDMNVIAGNGLVGIISEAGEHYSKVRAIIDDKSNVSAMFEKSGETCMVKGNMESIFNGYIDVEMISNSAHISDGDEVVTSHVSDKYLQGLSVGYVKDVKDDPTTLTKTAHLTPVVSFDQLETVLVITQLKDSTEVKDMSNYD
ncbi:MAG: rod shape-determining protein MreC [Eubacterium sp.]|nr:rod shape-determining protein MreC [Eubacterium sp.]